jgi:hypothetical protein
MEDIEILNSYGIPAIKRGGVVFIPRANVLKAIELLIADGYKILGIDAFTLKEKSTQPWLDYSTDYSNSEIPTISQFESFFDGVPDIVTHYEIVFR